MAHTYTTEKHNGRWYIVEDGRPIEHEHFATKAAAEKRARLWKQYNGPPVTGLSDRFNFGGR